MFLSRKKKKKVLDEVTPVYKFLKVKRSNQYLVFSRGLQTNPTR